MMTDKPHNNFFAYVFSQKQVIKDFIEQLLPDLADKIDIESLQIDNTSYIDKRLQDFYSDIVYNAETKGKKKIKISLLLEHKSTPPMFPHLQLFDYMQGIWRMDETKKMDKTVRKRKKLTPVIPIIFYHGKQKWTKHPFLNSFEELDDDLAAFIPNIDYHLVDLKNYDDDFLLKLRTGFLINSLLAFKHKNDGAYVKEHFARIFVNLEATAFDEQTKNFLGHLSVYIVITTELKAKEVIEVIEKLPTNTKNIMMTAYYNILLEGEKIGIEKGVEIGIEKGEKIGIEKGVEIGQKQSDEKKSLEIAIDLLENNISDSLILNISKISETTLVLLKDNVSSDFKIKKSRLALAKHLFKTFQYLKEEDLLNVTKISAKELLNLKNSNKF